VRIRESTVETILTSLATQYLNGWSSALIEALIGLVPVLALRDVTLRDTSINDRINSVPLDNGTILTSVHRSIGHQSDQILQCLIHEPVQQALTLWFVQCLREQVGKVRIRSFLCNTDNISGNSFPSRVVRNAVLLLRQHRLRDGCILIYRLVVAEDIRGTLNRYPEHS
jgi:hypothetical protein